MKKVLALLIVAMAVWMVWLLYVPQNVESAEGAEELGREAVRLGADPNATTQQIEDWLERREAWQRQRR